MKGEGGGGGGGGSTLSRMAPTIEHALPPGNESGTKLDFQQVNAASRG
jgi:hypothetical protein